MINTDKISSNNTSTPPAPVLPTATPQTTKTSAVAAAIPLDSSATELTPRDRVIDSTLKESKPSPSVLPSNLMSIMASFIGMPQIRPVVTVLEAEISRSKVIEDAFNEQIISRNTRNDPMDYTDFLAYVHENPPEAVFPNIHQLNLNGYLSSKIPFSEIFSKCPKLEWLELARTDLFDTELPQKLRVLPLHHLNLSWSNFQTRHLHVLTSLGLQLKNLNICYTRVDDNDLPLLQAFPLQNLDISGCTITDAGLRQLNMLHLQSLNLSKTQVSAQAVATLKETYPKLEVIV